MTGNQTIIISVVVMWEICYKTVLPVVATEIKNARNTYKENKCQFNWWLLLNVKYIFRDSD